MISAPPLLEGAVQERPTSVLPAVGMREVGELGVVAGVATEEAVDVAPVPKPLTAATLKV